MKKIIFSVFLFSLIHFVHADEAKPLHELSIKGQTLHVEIAQTPKQKAHGLMHRDSLAPDHGMLFVFEEPRQVSFWMKNTRIPLSIAYIDSKGKILEIYDMKPFDTTSISSKSNKIAYALEVNLGWYKEKGIKAGDVIDFEGVALKLPLKGSRP